MEKISGSQQNDVLLDMFCKTEGLCTCVQEQPEGSDLMSMDDRYVDTSELTCNEDPTVSRMRTFALALLTVGLESLREKRLTKEE